MDYHRKVCNNVKKEILLLAYLKTKELGNVTLLDLCCGRGGDIFKWNSVGIKKVIAVDNHKESIKEAINRYKKVNKNFKTKISFFVKDVENLNFNQFYKNCLIVSIQFALHYFNNLQSLISRISNILKPGGYFIGVCPDGDIIDSLLDKETKIKNVELNRKGPSSYSINLLESVSDNNKTENYFKFKGESIEYIIRKEELKNIASNFGLELVKYSNLKDEWKGNHISKLYFSFIFVKKI